MYAVSSEDTEAPPQPLPSDLQSEEEEDDEEEEEEVEEEEDAAEDEEDDEEEEGGETPLHPPPAASLSSSTSPHLLITAVSNLSNSLFLSSSSSSSSSSPHNHHNHHPDTTLREIGKEALCWQLSSAKPGNGVEQIRDGNLDSYWQSDGTKQPHWIQVHFARRVAISHVCLYLDYALDESYTPKKIHVDHGLTQHDLQPALYPAATEIEFQEPVGWCIVPLSSPPDPLDECCGSLLSSEWDPTNDTANNYKHQQRNVVRTHLLRISILSMHQNGRDTHVRQVELYGPRRRTTTTTTTTTNAVGNHHHGGGGKLLRPQHPTMVVEEEMDPEHQDGDNDHNDDDDDDDDFGTLPFSSFGTIR